MGKGGGFAAMSPLDRVLADKRAAADARARLVVRLKRQPTEPELPHPIPEEKAPPQAAKVSDHFRARLLSGTSHESAGHTSEKAKLKALVQFEPLKADVRPPTGVMHALDSTRLTGHYVAGHPGFDTAVVRQPNASALPRPEPETGEMPNVAEADPAGLGAAAGGSVESNPGSAIFEQFPASALEAVDLTKAATALKALSKRSFDRVRAWREVDDAIRYMHSLGYRGSKDDADDHLRRLIDLRGETAHLATTQPETLPSVDERASDPDTPDVDETGQTEIRPADVPSAPEAPVNGIDVGSEIAPVDRDVKPTVADLLGAADISVRLSNIMLNNELFSEWTVARALTRKEEFLERVLALNNAGKKTVREVEGLLAQHASGNLVIPDFEVIRVRRPRPEISGDTLLVEAMSEVETTSLGPTLLSHVLGTLTVSDYTGDPLKVEGAFRTIEPRGRRRKAIEEVFRALNEALALGDFEWTEIEATPEIVAALEVPIERVLKMRTLSVRLENVLAADVIRTLNVRDFVDDREGFIRTLMAIKNSGRKTVGEACQHLDDYVAAIKDGALPLPDDDAIEGQDDDAGSRLEAEAVEAARLAPRESLLAAIASLPENERQVIHWRYGISVEPPRTLQEIADVVHVSRERVRQVEQKGLRRLQKGTSRFALSAFIAAEQDRQWALLADDDVKVPFDELTSRTRRLDPLFVVAVEANFGRVRDWLDGFATAVAGGWAWDALEVEKRENLTKRIADVAAGFPMPMPLDMVLRELGDDCDPLLAGTLDLIGLHVFEGYVCKGYLGARLRRQVRLHRVARTIAKSGIFDIGTLIRAYRQNHSDDDAASRLVHMELEEAPHLFASLFDGIWLVLPVTDGELHLAAPPFEEGVVKKDAEFADGSVNAAILELLETRGPTRQSEIVARIVADKGAARGSVIPTMLMNPGFRRVAPSYFGLYDGQEELKGSFRQQLLTERSCRTYCLMRHSGAPLGYFPAWSTDFELDLVHWSHSNAPTELFRSLLSVIEPRTWNVPAEIVSQVEAEIRREARWSIGADRGAALGRRFIDPEQFLAVLAHLAVFGWIGWCAVNRLSGAALITRDAADVLALLILMGLVEPTDDWQSAHTATPLATTLFRAAADRRHRVGHLDWADDILGPVLDGIRSPRERLGWIEPVEAEAGIEKWRSGTLSGGTAYRRGTTAPINPDDTFDSPEWDKAFEELF